LTGNSEVYVEESLSLNLKPVSVRCDGRRLNFKSVTHPVVIFIREDGTVIQGVSGFSGQFADKQLAVNQLED